MLIHPDDAAPLGIRRRRRRGTANAPRRRAPPRPPVRRAAARRAGRRVDLAQRRPCRRARHQHADGRRRAAAARRRRVPRQPRRDPPAVGSRRRDERQVKAGMGRLSACSPSRHRVARRRPGHPRRGGPVGGLRREACRGGLPAADQCHGAGQGAPRRVAAAAPGPCGLPRRPDAAIVLAARTAPVVAGDRGLRRPLGPSTAARR